MHSGNVDPVTRSTAPVERLVEGGKPPAWVKHEHEARYQWAATLAAGKAVVDVACGTGYGAPRLLKSGASSVHGYDLDEASIDEARRIHGWSGAHFDVADGTEIPAEDDTFDLYLSFETIEHVPDDRAYLAEAARILKPGGKLLCSTPNRNVTNPGTRITDQPYNPFHVREYTRPELHELLSERFNVGFIGQTPRQWWWVSLLGQVGKMHPRLAVRAHQARKLAGLPFERIDRHRPTLWPRHGEAEVIIAVCTLR
jgi:ubiquinone/menaquinone biosynthesis C-methylase UbiE